MQCEPGCEYQLTRLLLQCFAKVAVALTRSSNSLIRSICRYIQASWSRSGSASISAFQHLEQFVDAPHAQVRPP